MIIKDKIQVAKMITLSGSEVNALERSISILSEIYLSLDDDTVLSSPITGEIIETAELPRVLGILGGFIENATWTVK